MANLLRFVALVEFVLIFFAWLVIMGRSYRDYRIAKREGGDSDLRLHIWLITISYLIFVAGTGYDVVENIGSGPIELDDAPLLFVAAPLGLYALWLFLRPSRRQRIEPDDRTTTIDG